MAPKYNDSTPGIHASRPSRNNFVHYLNVFVASTAMPIPRIKTQEERPNRMSIPSDDVIKITPIAGQPITINQRMGTRRIPLMIS